MHYDKCKQYFNKCYEAHRDILSASNHMLRDVLNQTKHSHPSIYMRGITLICVGRIEINVAVTLEMGSSMLGDEAQSIKLLHFKIRRSRLRLKLIMC